LCAATNKYIKINTTTGGYKLNQTSGNSLEPHQFPERETPNEKFVGPPEQ
jgi:hypothetical protein